MGAPDLPCRGGGFNQTSMAQNDIHVALTIWTTQMCGGGLLVDKTFSGQIHCSCAFGANIHSCTKQRARHGTQFLQKVNCVGRPRPSGKNVQTPLVLSSKTSPPGTHEVQTKVH